MGLCGLSQKIKNNLNIRFKPMSKTNHTLTPSEHKPTHKPSQKRRKKHNLWQRKHPSMKPSASASHWIPGHTIESSQHTNETSRSLAATRRKTSRSGCSESSSIGSRKLKNQSLFGTSGSEIKTMPFSSSIGIGFVAGLILVLLGYWLGHNVRAVEEIGQKYGVRYVLPAHTEHSPHETRLTRVSF